MTLFFHPPVFGIEPLSRPELRKDPIVDRWVVISTDRLGRPQEFEAPPTPEPLELCPFCAGHESLTREATYVYPSAANWQVRVVPNTFPAVRGGGEYRLTQSGLLQSGPGLGVHEVIIASPNHETTLARLPAAHLTEVFRAFRQRVRSLKRERPELYPFIFNNHKAAAGASLEHVHTQLVALPKVPDLVEREIDASSRYWRQNQRCVFCDLIALERRDGARMLV